MLEHGVGNHQIDAVIATNTTINRPGQFANVREPGGLSGTPLHHRSVEVVNYISRRTNGDLPIIGVGGIHNPETAGAMIDNGASLVQVYTGMVYHGPLIAKTIANHNLGISNWPPKDRAQIGIIDDDIANAEDRAR